MAQSAPPEAPRDVGEEYCLGDYSVVSSVAEPLFGARRTVGRSQVRECLSAPLWLTSLHEPGIFEVVPTQNVSRFGIRVVTQESRRARGCFIPTWILGARLSCLLQEALQRRLCRRYPA